MKMFVYGFILKSMTLTLEIICSQSRYIITVEDAGVFASWVISSKERRIRKEGFNQQLC
jgi:hypothetical protein